MNYSEAGKKGHINSLPALLLIYKNKKDAYEKIGKRCPRCNILIPYGKRRNKFCSHHCAKIGNKNGMETTEIKTCLTCQKPLKYSWKKYCNIACHKKDMWTKRVDLMLKRGYEKSTFVKKYFLEKYGRECMICHTKEWQQQPIPLILDHINGNPMDNSLTNFRLICPNCDALLPTYTGRNKGKGRAIRRKFYKKHGYS